MRKWLLLGVALGVLLVGSVGIVWDAAWEARPAGGDLASDIDLFINELKQQIGDRSQVETIFGIGTNDNGLLRLGAARCFMQNGAPTDLTGLGAFNSTADAFVGTVLGTNEPGGSIDQGTGRCWIDLDGLDGVAGSQDDNQLNVWIDTVGWTPITALSAARLGSNLIYNGSFEITDGTGSLASTTVPHRWTLVLTPTIGYVSVNNSTEGDGVALTTIAAGAPLEGVSRTLAGLKELRTYVYRARVAPQVGTCRLLVDDGTTNASDTSVSGGGVFETLEVSHTTTAAPADVVVSLLSVADTNDCDWDHVTAFERDAAVASPGVQFIYTTDSVSDATIDTTFGNNPFVATTVHIPSAGYNVVIDAAVSLNNNTNDGACMARLARDDCAGGVFTAVSPVAIMNAGNLLSGVTVPLNFVDTNPVVGGACIYRIEVREDAVIANCEVNDANMQNNTVQTGSWLRATLLPTR